MKDYEYTYEVLLKTVVDGISFNTSIRNVLNSESKKINPTIKSTIYAVCGCVLRHYFIFKEIITKQYGEIEEEKILAIALGLGNKEFAKRIDQNKLNKFIVKKTGLDGVPVFIDCYDNPKRLIPEDAKYSHSQYCSLRYNVPEWIVDLWQKDGGNIVSKKLFHCLTHREDNLVRINENVISTKEFLNKYKDYMECGESGVARLTKQIPIWKTKACQEGDALRIPLSYKCICDELDISCDKSFAIYACGTNHLLEELYVKLGPNFNANYFCGHSGHALEANDCISKYALTDTTLVECDYTKLKENISSKVNTFFVCPRSTFLLGLYERADHFLRLKKEDLNTTIKTEYESLCAASEFVKDGGNLVYLVTTFCNGEGHRLINRFLKEHKEYELHLEKQMFPFDKYQTMLYFAILKRIK